jgi:hypothetical protein
MKAQPKDIRIDLDSKVWGPKGWFFIDSVVLSYPLNPNNVEKEQYKNYFYSFPVILPCTKCRVHFNEYINKYPLNDYILSSKKNMITWILNAHNNVPDSIRITIDEYYAYYNNKYNIDVQNDNCVSTCGVKQINNHMLKNKNEEKYKFLSIILFGIIVSLSLYLLRSMQIAHRKII